MYVNELTAYKLQACWCAREVCTSYKLVGVPVKFSLYVYLVLEQILVNTNVLSLRKVARLPK